MALKMNFREVTPEDTEILRMIALRNGKAEDYLCCDVTNEDGVTQTTWYSKADVALWGEDYIRTAFCWIWAGIRTDTSFLSFKILIGRIQSSSMKQQKGISFPSC